MNEARRIEVSNQVYFRLVKGDPFPTIGAIAEAVSIGIETALAWREDEAVRDGWVEKERE